MCSSDLGSLGPMKRVLVTGATGNVGRQVVEQLRNSYDGLRISPQIPDYIAAGSYFSLCWMTALGLAIASVRYRATWLVAAARQSNAR